MVSPVVFVCIVLLKGGPLLHACHSGLAPPFGKPYLAYVTICNGRFRAAVRPNDRATYGRTSRDLRTAFIREGVRSSAGQEESFGAGTAIVEG